MRIVFGKSSRSVLRSAFRIPLLFECQIQLNEAKVYRLASSIVDLLDDAEPSSIDSNNVRYRSSLYAAPARALTLGDVDPHLQESAAEPSLSTNGRCRCRNRGLSGPVQDQRCGFMVFIPSRFRISRRLFTIEEILEACRSDSPKTLAKKRWRRHTVVRLNRIT